MSDIKKIKLITDIAKDTPGELLKHVQKTEKEFANVSEEMDVLEGKLEDDKIELEEKIESIKDEIEVIEGERGKDGKDGRDGKDGVKGDKGDPGRDGKPGKDGEDGKDGKDGTDGKDGEDGEMGPMPKHEWKDTWLRLEESPDEWGKWVDLRGPEGRKGAGGIGGGRSIKVSNNDNIFGIQVKQINFGRGLDASGNNDYATVDSRMSPIDDDYNFYIATTGDDTTGDGTQVNPWRTPDKAYSEAAGVRTNGTIIINVADGNYSGAAGGGETVLPPTLLSTVKLLGNIVTPSNVVFEPSAFGTFMDARRVPGATLQFDGFKVSGGLLGIYNSYNVVEIGQVIFDQTIFALLGTYNAAILLTQALSGAPTLIGDGSSFGAGITGFSTVTVVDEWGSSITGFQTCINITDLSTYSLSNPGGGTTQVLQTVDNASAICIQASNNSSVTLARNVDFDCIGKKGVTAAIRLNTSNLTTISGLTFNVDNCESGVLGTVGSNVFPSSGTWNFTNVDFPVSVDNTSFAGDVFGVAIERADSAIDYRNGHEILKETVVSANTFTTTNFTEKVSVDYSATGAVAGTLIAITEENDGVPFVVKDTGYNAATNNITLTPTGADTIEGQPSATMIRNGESWTLLPNLRTNNYEII